MPIYDDEKGQIFETNPSKDYIREKIDKSLLEKRLIEKVSQEKVSQGLSTEEKLRYFGLPGPYMHDIQAWDNQIGFTTCIEKYTNCKDIMVETAYLFERINSSYVFKDDIEAVLKNMDRLSPKFKNSYDIANLDFYGPGIYLDRTGNSPRTDAIKQFVQHQSKRHNEIGDVFLMFLTVNLRTSDGRRNQGDQVEAGQVDKILSEIKRNSLNLEGLINHIGSKQEHFRLKIAIPRLMRQYSEGFDVTCYPVYYYAGTGSVPMLHFQFRYDYTGDLVPDHKQSVEDFCKLPLIQVIVSGGKAHEKTLFSGEDWQ